MRTRPIHLQSNELHLVTAGIDGILNDTRHIFSDVLYNLHE